MTIATTLSRRAKKVLMLGLGGGSISTYLGRFMPEIAIDTVEIDRRVIKAAKTIFRPARNRRACAISMATAASSSTATRSSTT